MAWISVAPQRGKEVSSGYKTLWEVVVVGEDGGPEVIAWCPTEEDAKYIANLIDYNRIESDE